MHKLFLFKNIKNESPNLQIIKSFSKDTYLQDFGKEPIIYLPRQKLQKPRNVFILEKT